VILTLLAILVVAVLASVWLVRKLRESEHAPVAHPALDRSGAAPLATTRP
jgi:uncharacterized membrane protein YqjE